MSNLLNIHTASNNKLTYRGIPMISYQREKSAAKAISTRYD